MLDENVRTLVMLTNIQEKGKVGVVTRRVGADYNRNGLFSTHYCNCNHNLIKLQRCNHNHDHDHA